MLLATFVKYRDIEEAYNDIVTELNLSDDKVFILKLVSYDNKEKKYVITYNWHGDKNKVEFEYHKKWPTISVHRKKLTNTIYTINALNTLIKELHGDIDPKEVMLEWEQYKNTMMLSGLNKETNRQTLKLYKTFVFHINKEENGVI